MGELILKFNFVRYGSLKLGSLKSELLVIVDHHATVKWNLEDVLIARQEPEVIESKNIDTYF